MKKYPETFSNGQMSIDVLYICNPAIFGDTWCLRDSFIENRN